MKKRLLALVLSLTLVLSLLTGCGSSEEGIPAAAQQDVVRYLTDGAMQMDDVVGSVNGTDVTAPYYLYWLAYYTTVMEGNGLTAEALDVELEDGTTPAQAIQPAAEYAVSFYYTMSQKAQEEGYSLTEEESQLDDAMDEHSLLYYCTNAAEQNTLYQQYSLANKLQTDRYGEAWQAALSEEDLLSYGTENGYYTCRYILFSTLDENMEEIDDPESQKELCEQVYKELQAVEPDQLEETFQTYQEQYNVTDTNTDRFTFQTGGVVQGFADLTKGLEEQELGMTEEATEYGYFVVLRLPLELDESTQSSLRQNCASTAFTDQVDAWMEEGESTFSEAVQTLDVTAFCTKLMELQTTIDGVEAAQAEAEADSSAG